jgi:hypothetical protein
MPRNTEELFLYHSQKARYYKNLLAIWWKDVKKNTIQPKEREEMEKFFEWYDTTIVMQSREACFYPIKARYIHKLKEKWYTFQRIGDLFWKNHTSILYIYKTYNANGTRKEKTKYETRTRKNI